jgi:hypothetical protein
MAKTFKEQVEEILRDNEHCRTTVENPPCQDLNSCSEQTCLMACKYPRILSAHNAELDRIAEGMPLTKETAEDFRFRTKAEAYLSGKVLQHADAQAYIQAQKGS